MGQLDEMLAAIDAVNAHDPNGVNGTPASLLYGQRMSQEAARQFPNASAALQIAAHGQHIER